MAQTLWKKLYGNVYSVHHNQLALQYAIAVDRISFYRFKKNYISFYLFYNSLKLSWTQFTQAPCFQNNITEIVFINYSNIFTSIYTSNAELLTPQKSELQKDAHNSANFKLVVYIKLI